jgi:hypothetical protein
MCDFSDMPLQISIDLPFFTHLSPPHETTLVATMGLLQSRIEQCTSKTIRWASSPVLQFSVATDEWIADQQKKLTIAFLSKVFEDDVLAIVLRHIQCGGLKRLAALRLLLFSTNAIKTGVDKYIIQSAAQQFYVNKLVNSPEFMFLPALESVLKGDDLLASELVLAILVLFESLQRPRRRFAARSIEIAPTLLETTLVLCTEDETRVSHPGALQLVTLLMREKQLDTFRELFIASPSLPKLLSCPSTMYQAFEWLTNCALDASASQKKSLVWSTAMALALEHLPTASTTEALGTFLQSIFCLSTHAILAIYKFLSACMCPKEMQNVPVVPAVLPDQISDPTPEAELPPPLVADGILVQAFDVIGLRLQRHLPRGMTFAALRRCVAHAQHVC